MRALMILAGAVGFVLFAGLVYLNVAKLAMLRDDPAVLMLTLPGGAFWTLIYLIGVAVSVGLMVMKPREFKESWKEPEVPRAAWLDEKRDPPG